MLLFGLDYETTWSNPVDPKSVRITEVGAVLWDTQIGAPVEMYNTLVYDESYPEIPPEGVELNGISTELLKKRGISPHIAHTAVERMVDEADFVVAHNGNDFDKVIYIAECARQKIHPRDASWIDTRTDVPYPGFIKTRKLTHLAADHGFANPFAHRALFDVMTMLKILSLYPLEQVIELAKQPTVTVLAQVTFEDKQLAKDRSYMWDGERKKWFKKMKLAQAEKEKTDAPFMVRILEETY